MKEEHRIIQQVYKAKKDMEAADTSDLRLYSVYPVGDGKISEASSC